jgi:hypothetical protein
MPAKYSRWAVGILGSIVFEIGQEAGMSPAMLMATRPTGCKPAASVPASGRAAPRKAFFTKILDALKQSRRRQVRRMFMRFANLVAEESRDELRKWLDDK